MQNRTTISFSIEANPTRRPLGLKERNQVCKINVTAGTAGKSDSLRVISTQPVGCILDRRGGATSTESTLFLLRIRHITALILFDPTHRLVGQTRHSSAILRLTLHYVRPYTHTDSLVPLGTALLSYV